MKSKVSKLGRCAGFLALLLLLLLLACWLFIWGGRRDVRRIYERKSDAAA